MSREYDCENEEQREAGIADAASAVRRGELVVLPTDTVYGVGADAFSPDAVAALLDAKGRDRSMPAPVLVGSAEAAKALIDDLGPHGQSLIDAFWPGPLTLVCAATPSLTWDLGNTKGTVAVRMPEHSVALDLLKKVGPMAVSSANRSGEPAARTAKDAREQLGDSVAVYLEAGPCPDEGLASTIVDLTYAVPRVLREGAVAVERLRETCGTVIGVTKRPRTTSVSRGKRTQAADEPAADEPADKRVDADTAEAAGAAEATDNSAAAEGTGPRGKHVEDSDKETTP